MSGGWNDLPALPLSLVFQHLAAQAHGRPATCAARLLCGPAAVNGHWRAVALQEVELHLACDGSAEQVRAVVALAHTFDLRSLAFSGLDASCAPAPNQRIFERRSCWQAAFDLLADETFQGVAGSSLRELRGAPFWRSACKRRSRERPQLLLHAFPQLRRLQVALPDDYSCLGWDAHWHPQLEELVLPGYLDLWSDALPPRLQRLTTRGAALSPKALAGSALAELSTLPGPGGCSAPGALCLHHPIVDDEPLPPLGNYFTAPPARRLQLLAEVVAAEAGVGPVGGRLEVRFASHICFLGTSGEMWDLDIEKLPPGGLHAFSPTGGAGGVAASLQADSCAPGEGPPTRALGRLVLTWGRAEGVE